MNNITQAKSQANIIEEQYLLTHIEERVAQNGNIFKKITLEDSSGKIFAYVWPKSGMLHKLPFATPARVRVLLNVRELNGHPHYDLVAIYTLASHDVWNAAKLLPLSQCPFSAKEALHSLVRFIDYLPKGSLKAFVNDVFFDKEIAQNFLTAKASINHHHNQIGGLIIHSVDVLRLAYETARACNLDEVETNIIAVAALLHDIGKIRTVGTGHPRPVHYMLVKHEVQNLMLLNKHLEELDARAPTEAAALKYIFNYLLAPRRDRKFAEFIGAEVVAIADSLSAALTNQRRLADLIKRRLPALPSQRVIPHS